MREYYTKIAREGSISFSSQLISIVLNYLTAIFITRALGAEGYGTYCLGYSIIQTLTIFAGLGLSDALIRYIALFLGKNDLPSAKGVWHTVSRFMMVTYLLLTISIFFSAPLIAQYVFHKPELTPIIRILSLSYPALSVTLLVDSYFKANKNLLIPSLLQNVFSPGGKLIFAVGIFFLSLNETEWSWAFALNSFLIAMIAIYFYQKITNWRDKKATSISLKTLLQFSLPIWGAQAIPVILGQLNVLLLGFFYESKEVGIYKVYVFFASFISFGFGSLAGIFYPVFSELVSKGNKFAMQDLYQRVTKWFHLISFNLSFLVLMTGLWFVPILFGEDYRLTSPTVLYLIISGHILNSLTGPDYMTLKSLGWTKFFFLSSCFAFVSNLVFGYIFIPKYGIAGAALATMISTGIRHFYGLHIIRNNLRIKILSKQARNFLVVGLPFLLILFYMNYVLFYSLKLTLIIIDCCLIIFYTIIVIKLKIIDSEDRFIIFKFYNKIIGAHSKD